MHNHSFIRRTGALLMLAGMLSGCLDKYPDDAIPMSEAVQTVKDADQAVMGIYAAFKSSSLYSGLLTLLPDLQCDLVYGVNGWSNTHGDIWRNEILATNGSTTAVYAQLYGVIGQCNFALDEMERLRPTIKDDEQIDKLDQLCGEAYFARALCYSELLKLYCQPYDSDAEAASRQGVVIRTHYHTDEPLKRSSLKDSYAIVLADLDRAAELLKLEKDFDGALFNTGYFNEYTVYALRARVHLYMRQWEKAIEYSSKVIDSGYYLLSSASEMYSSTQSYYQYMWSSDNSTEVIWKVAFTTDAYGGALGQIFFNYDFVTMRPDYVPAQWVFDLYDSNDLRPMSFYYTAQTGYSHGLTWPLLYKYFGNPEFTALRILHVNMPKVLRLSEQYLIRAEAYANLPAPNYQKAAKDIGTLRAARYKSYSGSPVMNATTAMKVIEEERVKELIMEGFRLMDLKRWHKGFKRTPQAESIANGSSLSIPPDDPRLTWPIPQHEIESPDADIEQNK